MQSFASAQRLAPFTTQRQSKRQRRLPAASRVALCSSSDAQAEDGGVARRAVLLAGAALAAGTVQPLAASAAPPFPRAKDFEQTPSGLLYEDILEGTGPSPQLGDLVVVHWAGRTKNYQAKIIDNTSKRDEPYEFRLGAHEAIPAFEEAVATMRVGGVRRLEVLGEIPELSYARDRSQRYASPLKYRLGPQPKDFDGLRALDFVLDNNVLDDTNRTLLFDIKLLAVRK